jgi:hypothetical protein
MYDFIALIDSNSAGSVNQTSIIQNFLSIFATGSAGSLSNNGGIVK